MRALANRKAARVLCFVLCLVFTAFGALSWTMARLCWVSGWYEASPYASRGTDFANSDYAVDYVNDCFYYIYQYILWQGKITEDVVSGYGGAAFSILITDVDTGKIVLDTRTSASHRVDMELTTTFADGGTRLYSELAAQGDEAAIAALVNHTWRMQGYVNLPVEPYDGCYAEYVIHGALVVLRPYLIPAAVVLLALALAAAVGLVWISALHEPEKRNLFDRVPMEAFAAVVLLLCLVVGRLGWSGCERLLYSRLGGQIAYYQLAYSCLRPVWTALEWTAAGLLTVWSLLRRVRRHELRQSSLCVRTPAAWRMTALLGLSALFAFVWIFRYRVGTEAVFYLYFDGWTIALLLSFLAALVHAVMLAVQLGRLNKGARELAAGHFDHQIRCEGLMSGLREQGGSLNSIGAGMKAAVDERLKGERFKTELITNVSHDLKTPLTSIVSYVDLLKKEEVPSPTAREYIEVIDRQSAKLKKLTEDLVEASRASSGAIAVHPEPTDVRELLSQSVGEYTERLASRGVEAVMGLPGHGVVLDTDGRLLWRVLENLTQNIVKYAQRGTRAYFDLASENGHVTIALKNTSAEALNIPAEELMERFVRGDVSRHTEGSGLGLSIAQSLTELLGGEMALYLDGDLFKVTLSFDGARES